MQLISKYNKGIRCLLCVIAIYDKCAWVVSLKVKKDVTVVNGFHESKRNQKKICVEKGNEFYNKSIKS